MENEVKQSKKYTQVIDSIHKQIDIIENKTNEIRVQKLTGETEAISVEQKTELQSSLEYLLNRLERLSDEIIL